MLNFPTVLKCGLLDLEGIFGWNRFSRFRGRWFDINGKSKDNFCPDLMSLYN